MDVLISGVLLHYCFWLTYGLDCLFGSSIEFVTVYLSCRFPFCLLCLYFTIRAVSALIEIAFYDYFGVRFEYVTVV